MQIASVIRAMQSASAPLPVGHAHTGKHCDPEMNGQFARALEIPNPDINLNAGSGTLAVQAAVALRGYFAILEQDHPAAVLAVRDTNSMVSCCASRLIARSIRR